MRFATCCAIAGNSSAGSRGKVPINDEIVHIKFSNLTFPIRVDKSGVDRVARATGHTFYRKSRKRLIQFTSWYFQSCELFQHEQAKLSHGAVLWRPAVHYAVASSLAAFLLIQGSAETIRLRPGLDDVRLVGQPVEHGLELLSDSFSWHSESIGLCAACELLTGGRLATWRHVFGLSQLGRQVYYAGGGVNVNDRRNTRK
jgi:hypothetical protein